MYAVRHLVGQTPYALKEMGNQIVDVSITMLDRHLIADQNVSLIQTVHRIKLVL